MAYKEKADQAAANRRHYEANREKVAARAAASREQLRAWLVGQKSKPCMDCGGSFPPYCMDFDHRPGEVKLGQVARFVSMGQAAKARAEVVKCDLVCANCHRIRTWSDERPRHPSHEKSLTRSS